MKKTTTLGMAAVMLLTLSACKDASVDISNGSEVLFTVGSTKVTNDDIFTPIFTSSGFNEVATRVNNIIYEKEVPADEAIQADAKKILADAKASLGDNFSAYLNQAGMKDEEEYLSKVAMPSAQAKALTKKYLEANAEEQITTYKPVKVRVIQCTSDENAKNALTAAQQGESMEAIATQFGKTDTYKGDEIIVNQSSGLPSALWAKISVITDQEAMINEVITDTITDSENPVYYVAKVTNTKALDEFKEEAIDSILNTSTTAQKDAMVYYLKQYNFHVYDIDIYNSYKSNNPDYLVQDAD